MNKNEELECIFIQTDFMKKWYLDFADVHHVDSTFKVNIENFQLFISLVHNQHGRGIPTGYMLTKSNCDENIDFFYQNLTGK